MRKFFSMLLAFAALASITQPAEAAGTNDNPEGVEILVQHGVIEVSVDADLYEGLGIVDASSWLEVLNAGTVSGRVEEDGSVRFIRSAAVLLGNRVVVPDGEVGTVHFYIGSIRQRHSVEVQLEVKRAKDGLVVTNQRKP